MFLSWLNPPLTTSFAQWCLSYSSLNEARSGFAKFDVSHLRQICTGQSLIRLIDFSEREEEERAKKEREEAEKKAYEDRMKALKEQEEKQKERERAIEAKLERERNTAQVDTKRGLDRFGDK